MMDRECIKEKLMEYIKITRKIAIIPMGKWGKICKEILENDLREEIKNKDVLYLDNYYYDNETVYSVEREENWHPDRLYLITAMNENVQKEIKTQILKYIDESQLLNLFEDLITKWTELYGKIHLDFLCCGFMKCCTTSLHVALKQNSHIYLPDIKETQFIENIYWSNAHRILHQAYPSDRTSGKIVGGIEASYFRSAKEVRNYFDENLKILFFVRNPVKALYSLFRMYMRDGGSGGAAYYLEKYKKITSDVFDEWIEKEWGKEMFLYMDYINEYLRYYSEDKIKVVIVEELLQSPNDIMKGIQEHIELGRTHFIEYKEMPLVNEGAQVPKDLACVYVNQKITDLFNETEGEETRKSIWRIRHLIYQITNEEYHCKMNKETENRLKSFYKSSICELERFLGRSLEGIWY